MILYLQIGSMTGCARPQMSFSISFVSIGNWEESLKELLLWFAWTGFEVLCRIDCIGILSSQSSQTQRMGSFNNDGNSSKQYLEKGKMMNKDKTIQRLRVAYNCECRWYNFSQQYKTVLSSNKAIIALSIWVTRFNIRLLEHFKKKKHTLVLKYFHCSSSKNHQNC